MSDTKTISEIFTRFIDIINSFNSLNRDIPNIELVNKILHSLLKSWEPKVMTILEPKDLSTLKLEQLC